MRVEDRDLPDDWGSMLRDASYETKNDWEREFIADLTDKYDQYGEQAFLSDAQYKHFRFIYNRSQ